MNVAARPIAVITGATGGIGRWIALGLAEAGFHLVVIAREPSRGRAAIDWIAAQRPESSIELRIADLSLLRATRRIGLEIAADHPRVALLVNNAGMFTTRRQLTTEGRERVLAVNYLAPQLLMQTLEDALRAGAPSRIVNVGSSTSDRARVFPEDLELTNNWGMVRSYGQSKLALMMSTFALAARLHGSGVVANVVHPGTVASGLIREPGIIGLAWRLMAPFSRTEQQGSITPLQAALAPEWASVSGAYLKDCAAARPNRRAHDADAVARVAEATRRLIEKTLD